MFKITWVLLGTLALSVPAGCSHTTQPGDAPPQQAVAMNETLDADKFEQLMKRPGTILVDVRTPEEYAQGHIAQAINMDVRNDQFTNQIGKLDRDKTILIYCLSGGRTQTAARIMVQLNFKSIGALKGGITQWVNQGKPVSAPSN